MSQIIDLASRVSTPLALSGLVTAFVFLIFRQIIARNIFPKLSTAITGTIIQDIINKLFRLALVAMILGFFGYIVSIGAQQPKPPPDSITISLPSGISLRDAAKMVAASEGYTAVFFSCADALLQGKVEPGTLTGKTSKELLEVLQYRIVSSRSAKKFLVERLMDRGIYEIHCE